MTSRNLARRLERLEADILPAAEEEPPLVLRIVSVSANGKRADTGIEFIVPAGSKLAKRRRW
jgi:hypothetical protein